MEEVEREIQYYKGEVSRWESKAAGHEERLGLLEKEGECRTWQCSCEQILLLLLTCDCVKI